MKNKFRYGFLIRGFFLLLLAFGLANATLTFVNYSLSSQVFLPGSSGAITLYISNLADAQSKDIVGLSLRIYTDPEIKISPQVSVGDMPVGYSTSVTIPFSIDENAKTGVYVLRIKSSGSASEGGDVKFRDISLPIKVLNPPSLIINANKHKIKEIDLLPVIIKNQGGIARKLTITPSGSCKLLGSTNIYIGDLSEEKNLTLSMDCRDAEEGSNTVPLLLSYYDELGEYHQETKELSITVEKDLVDLTFSQLSPVRTKEISPLSWRIRNNGKPLENVRISFVNTDSIKFANKDEINIGDINTNEDRGVKEDIYTTLSPGVNSVPLRVKWKEEGVEKETTIYVPVRVDSDVSIELYLDARPVPLRVSEEHSLWITVSNGGSFEIGSVDVKINGKDIQLLDVENKKYIGSLDADDSSEVQFKIKPLREGEIPIEIIVDYRDYSGEWKSRSFQKTLYIYPPESKSSLPLPEVALALIILGGGYYFFVIKKKKG